MDQKWVEDLVNICMSPHMFKTTKQRIEEFVEKTKVCQTQFSKGEITIDHVEDWCARNGVRLIQDGNLSKPCSSLWLTPSNPDTIDCVHKKCLKCNACVDGAGMAWKTPGSKGKFICGDCMYSDKKGNAPAGYIPGSCPPLDCGRPKNLTKKGSGTKDRLDMKTLLDSKKAFLDGDYEKAEDIIEGKRVEAPKKTEQPRYKINFYTDAGGCSLDEEEYAKTTKGIKRAIYKFAKIRPYLFCCYGLHIDVTKQGKKIKIYTNEDKCPIKTKVTKEGKIAKDNERIGKALFGKDGEVLLEKEDMSRLKLKFKRGYVVDYTFDWTFLEN